MSAVKLSDFEHKFGNPSDILHDALSGSFLEASKVMTPNGLKVYLDGAGSGAAVIDALATLEDFAKTSDLVTLDTTVRTSAFTAEAGNSYMIDTSSATFNITLPSSPTIKAINAAIYPLLQPIKMTSLPFCNSKWYNRVTIICGAEIVLTAPFSFFRKVMGLSAKKSAVSKSVK